MAVFVVVIVVAGFTLAWAPGWAPGWVLGRHTLCLLSADQGRSLSWDLLLGSRVSGQQCCRSRRQDDLRTRHFAYRGRYCTEP